MSILNRFIARDFLVTFAMTLAVFTSVMCLGVVVKAIDVAAKGISVVLILKIFALNVPFMLTFSIPMSILTSVLLNFGRMSFDGEVTAMKACGISMWQIVAPILVIALGFSAFCLYINTSLAPENRLKFRAMIAEVGAEEPIKLLEPGVFVRDFPGMLIYVSSRSGSEVKDVVVYLFDTNGITKQSTHAEYGRISVDKPTATMTVDLFNTHNDILRQQSNGEARWEHVDAKEYPYSFRIDQVLKRSKVRQKIGEMRYGTVVRNIREIATQYPELDPKDLARQRMTLMVEANKRLSLSASCFAFALIGIPLGMKSKRKESSAGIGIALALVFLFYMFPLIATQLVGKPHLRPDLIVWIPVLAAEILGFILIKRTN